MADFVEAEFAVYEQMRPMGWVGVRPDTVDLRVPGGAAVPESRRRVNGNAAEPGFARR